MGHGSEAYFLDIQNRAISKDYERHEVPVVPCTQQYGTKDVGASASWKLDGMWLHHGCHHAGHSRGQPTAAYDLNGEASLNAPFSFSLCGLVAVGEQDQHYSTSALGVWILWHADDCRRSRAAATDGRF